MASERALPVPVLTVAVRPVSSRFEVCEPVTVGIPFPAGAVRDARHIALRDEQETAVALQALPTESWPDGSVRWALLDFCSAGTPARERSYRVAIEPAADRPAGPRITIVTDPNGVVVNTGAATFAFRCGSAFPFARVTVGTTDVLDQAHQPALLLTDTDGRETGAVVARVVVEQQGDLRATIRVEGTAGGTPRSPLVDVIARVECFAGSGATRIAVTVRNPRRARHDGGLWELGDEGAVFFRDLSLRVPLHEGMRATCATELDAPFRPVDTDCELYQDSSGGDAWQHQTHVNRDNIVPCRFRGYRFRTRYFERTGLRATPALVLTQPAGALTLAVPQFWQNFPRAIEVEPRGLDVRFWPGQAAGGHELQGGEQKTHRIVLAFGDDPMSRDAVWWGRAPAAASMMPEWYSAAGAVPFLTPATDDTEPRYRQLIDQAIAGDTAFESKRDIVDEYGWRHFGDIYADHENPFAKDPSPIVSHYNNQYDAIGGFAVQFMRTADPRWSRLMTELATHVEDIDIYHTDRDKAAFNGGLFWHTYHYVAAGRSSHRSYPRRDGVCGGGPGNEHNYAGGLRLHWLLTGDPLSREAAISLANWVVNMDDGTKTVLRWISPTDTGLASASNTPDYHGPGRGAGNSILTLIDGHRLTSDERYLAKAEQLVRRCIHPSDDIVALTLLDAERRWSYIVFLQALGKYLDYKIERGENDRMYAYGRDALLHYARWMADHEYPYLDKPEVLEYPTETWAAQDIRKGEVFTFAAQHADGGERARFVDRAAFFVNASLSALTASATRALTRPVVLLLSNGFMRAANRPPEVRPAPLCTDAEYGSPSAFIPQKARAKLRLRQSAAAAMMLLALVVLGALTSCRMSRQPHASGLKPACGLACGSSLAPSAVP
jgi:exo-rhamnogalacturonan lyase-like protein